MSEGALFWLAAGGLALCGGGALGFRLLSEFSLSELEALCRRRQRMELFGAVLDHHERLAVGAESLRTAGGVLFVFAGGLWVTGGAALNVSRLLAAVVMLTIVLMATASWIPTSLVRLWSAPLLYATWPLWRFVGGLFHPLYLGVGMVGALLDRLAGREESTPEHEEEAFEDEIMAMVTEGQREGFLEADARQMIEGVIELHDRDVSDILTPRSEIDAIEVATPWRDMLSYIVDSGRTRIPVFESSLDNIIGVLYVKDLLSELQTGAAEPERSVRSLLRPAWFTPKTNKLDDLLRDFLKNHSHLAVVVDEYNAVCGVVTIEDVLEEIVGEIHDESDKEAEQEIVHLSDRAVLALGKVHLDDLNEQLGLELPEPDDYDTISGLVLDELKDIPEAGQSITRGDVRITVLKATRRRIEEVRIELLESANGFASHNGAPPRS